MCFPSKSFQKANSGSSDLFSRDFSIGFSAVLYSSGTSIASFPSDGLVIKQKLNHQGNEVVTGETKTEEDVPVLGLYQVPGPSSGRIVLYGDSNCLDSAHMEKGNCFCMQTTYKKSAE